MPGLEDATRPDKMAAEFQKQHLEEAERIGVERQMNADREMARAFQLQMMEEFGGKTPQEAFQNYQAAMAAEDAKQREELRSSIIEDRPMAQPRHEARTRPEPAAAEVQQKAMEQLATVQSGVREQATVQPGARERATIQPGRREDVTIKPGKGAREAVLPEEDAPTLQAGASAERSEDARFEAVVRSAFKGDPRPFESLGLTQEQVIQAVDIYKEMIFESIQAQAPDRSILFSAVETAPRFQHLMQTLENINKIKSHTKLSPEEKANMLYPNIMMLWHTMNLTTPAEVAKEVIQADEAREKERWATEEAAREERARLREAAPDIEAAEAGEEALAEVEQFENVTELINQLPEGMRKDEQLVARLREGRLEKLASNLVEGFGAEDVARVLTTLALSIRKHPELLARVLTPASFPEVKARTDSMPLGKAMTPNGQAALLKALEDVLIIPTDQAA